MTTKKSLKIPKKYNCIDCNYNTSSKKDYAKHLLTRKHLNTTKYNKPVSNYICDICDKTLDDRASLWRHKKTCKEVLKNELREPESEPVNEELPDVSKMITQEMVMSLLTQNQ